MRKVLSLPQMGALLFLAALLALCTSSARTLGQTVDETFYNGSGYPMVRYNNYEFLGEHPPLIIQLGALPLLMLGPRFPMEDYPRLPGSEDLRDISKVGAFFLYKMGNDPQKILFLERMAIVGLTVILGAGIFLFGRELYGEWGALLALGLYAFTPDVIGNGSLYTTDMGVTVFYFFTIYGLKKFFDQPSAKRIITVGILCGLAFVSKINSLILMPVISVLFLIYAVSGPRSFPEFSRRFEVVILPLIAYLLANAFGEKQAMVLFGPFLLLLLYLTGRDLASFKRFHLLGFSLKIFVAAGAFLCVLFTSDFQRKYGASTGLLTLMGTLVLLGLSLWVIQWPSPASKTRFAKYFLVVWVFTALTVILCYTDVIYRFHHLSGFAHYIRSMKTALSHVQHGHSGQVPGSFIPTDWRYFPFVMMIKTPLLVLLLSGIGGSLFLTSRRPLFIKAVIVIPIVFFLGTAMANKIMIGLRHILPIYPFLFLLGGYAGARLSEMRRGLGRGILLAVLSVFFVWFAARTIQAAPDQLVYFNEWIGNAEEGSKHLGSNWGQDNKALAELVIEKKISSIKILNEMGNPDIYDYYQIRWQWMEQSELAAPKPGFYALGIGWYLAEQNDPESWFRAKQPLYRAGKTIYVFQVP